MLDGANEIDEKGVTETDTLRPLLLECLSVSVSDQRDIPQDQALFSLLNKAFGGVVGAIAKSAGRTSLDWIDTGASSWNMRLLAHFREVVDREHPAGAVQTRAEPTVGGGHNGDVEFGI